MSFAAHKACRIFWSVHRRIRRLKLHGHYFSGFCPPENPDAHKIDSQLRETVAKASPRSWGNSPFHDLFSRDEANSAGAASKLVSAIEQVLEANGISPHFQAIEHKQPEQLLLAA